MINVIWAIIYLVFILCVFAVLVLNIYDKFFKKNPDVFPRPERNDKPKLRRVK